MKVIFSKKGMDSTYGKVVNPILPDGTMLSLPIPRPNEKYSYEKLFYEPLNKSLKDIIEELEKNKIKNKFNFEKYQNKKGEWIDYAGRCHADPFIFDYYFPKSKFNASLGYRYGNRNNFDKDPKKVEEKDLFLFFGTFKHTICNNGQLEYIRGLPKVHAIFGCLEVNRIEKNKENILNIHHWHPHSYGDYPKSEGNRLYISDKIYSKNFKYTEYLRLTTPGCTRRIWKLDEVFWEDGVKFNGEPIKEKSYFKPVKGLDGKVMYIVFTAPCYGQELFFDFPNDKNIQLKLEKWLKKIIPDFKIDNDNY